MSLSLFHATEKRIKLWGRGMSARDVGVNANDLGISISFAEPLRWIGQSGLRD